MKTKEILELIKETLKESEVKKFAIQIDWDKVRIEVEKNYSGFTNWLVYTHWNVTTPTTLTNISNTSVK